MRRATTQVQASRRDNEIDGFESLLNERQAAKLLSVSPRALQKWRSNGRGPLFI